MKAARDRIIQEVFQKAQNLQKLEKKEILKFRQKQKEIELFGKLSETIEDANYHLKLNM